MAEINVTKPKRVTRNDVAKRAGVSSAVVSYVINGSKFVSEERTEAVRKAIEELGYIPNVQARGLRTNSTMQIAFVCDNLRNDWLEGAEQILFDQGYYVSHCYSRDGDEFVRRLITRNFDGIFMMSNRFSTAQLNELADAGIPIVLYKTRNYGELHPRIKSVAPDIKDSIIKAVNYLVLKGHKRIALIPPIRYKTNGTYNDGFRISAYMDALQQNGIEFSEGLVCLRTESMDSILSEVFSMLTASDMKDRPTAFIAGNDFIAVKIMEYVKKLGMKIPDDVAVIGADNTYLSTVVTPPLTSIDFSKEEFSVLMANTLLGLIRGEEAEDHFIPVSVVIREST